MERIPETWTIGDLIELAAKAKSHIGEHIASRISELWLPVREKALAISHDKRPEWAKDIWCENNFENISVGFVMCNYPAGPAQFLNQLATDLTGVSAQKRAGLTQYGIAKMIAGCDLDDPLNDDLAMEVANFVKKLDKLRKTYKSLRSVS
jgi:hypothetical protein